MKTVLLSYMVCAAAALANAQGTSDLLKTSQEKIRSAQAITGTMLVTFPNTKPQEWRFRLLKPAFYEVVGPDQQFRFDGKNELVYVPVTKEYQQTEHAAQEIVDPPFLFGFGAFMGSSTTLTAVKAANSKIDGKAVTAFSVMSNGSNKPSTLYIDPASYLPVGYDQPLDQDVLSIRYRDVKVNEPLKQTDFAWAPPKGAKKMETVDYESRLLKPDAPAPAPSLKDPAGAPVNLADEFKSHKATVVYFWSGAPPVPELQDLKDLKKRLQDQKLEVIVVDFKTDPEETANYFKGNALNFPAIIDDKSTLAKSYGVEVPTEYVIGSDGKVVARFLGYDPEGVAQQLKKLGFRV
jgi:peroxiredoxin/outer membrane lipoprotein-sorting protein